jgi:hypothetical protein
MFSGNPSLFRQQKDAHAAWGCIAQASFGALRALG